jgi:hypothetical protein
MFRANPDGKINKRFNFITIHFGELDGSAAKGIEANWGVSKKNDMVLKLFGNWRIQ